MKALGYLSAPALQVLRDGGGCITAIAQQADGVWTHPIIDGAPGVAMTADTRTHLLARLTELRDDASARATYRYLAIDLIAVIEEA